MRYFKAFELETPPYLQFCSWANDEKELRELKAENDPLVVAEDDIPEFVNGICPWKIRGGQLVARDETEMRNLQTSLNNEVANDEFRDKIKNFKNATIEFNGHELFLHDSALAIYDLIDSEKVSVDVKTKTGKLTLSATEVARLKPLIAQKKRSILIGK